jgi:hypothetical protein
VVQVELSALGDEERIHPGHPPRDRDTRLRHPIVTIPSTHTGLTPGR